MTQTEALPDYVPAPNPCATQDCDYYRHYLLYGGPDLPHAAFHAAMARCLEAQQRVMDWYDQYPDGDAPEWLHRQAARWELVVRA